MFFSDILFYPHTSPPPTITVLSWSCRGYNCVRYYKPWLFCWCQVMGEGIATEGWSKCCYCLGMFFIDKFTSYFHLTHILFHLLLHIINSFTPSNRAHTQYASQAGNKADLEARRKVDFNEANAYAEENGILHMETSAKNSNNVRSLFVEIAKELPKATQQPDREAFPIMPQKQESRNCC